MLAIFLGAWLIVVGTLTISGAFAARRVLSDWWLLLITGLLEIPLGVLALANPGATLAALVTVGGIWAVAIGVMRIVLSFDIKRLPDEVDEAWNAPERNGAAAGVKPDAGRVAAAASCTSAGFSDVSASTTQRPGTAAGSFAVSVAQAEGRSATRSRLVSQPKTVNAGDASTPRPAIASPP